MTDPDPRPGEPPGAGGPRAVPEADAFRFDQVDQVGGGAHGPPAREGMALVFDERGIGISGSEGHGPTYLPWSQVTAVTVGDAVPGAGGGTETPVEVESSAGLLGYLVRSDRPQPVAMAALAQRVAGWRSPPEEVGPAAGPPSGEPVVAAAPHRPAASSPGGVPPRAVPDGLPAGFPEAPGLAPPPFGPPAFGFPVGYGPGPAPSHPDGRPKRTRRTATLVVALCLLVAGIGLAVGLVVTTSTHAKTAGPTPATTPASSGDQRLAEKLMLTQADLPTGWRVAKGGGATANSPTVQQGEVRITHTLARCMGITDSQASVVLGGQAADQTAQASSPIFVAPTSSASAGSALELQSAAAVVRTHQDEQDDAGLLANPSYPQCVATASAAELQLGVDQTSGGSDQPGPATVSTITLPAPDGVTLTGLLMAFTVKAGAASVPVQVESISLGSHRVEGSLQVFAIGGQIPNDTLQASIATFEQRVASGGKSSVV